MLIFDTLEEECTIRMTLYIINKYLEPPSDSTIRILNFKKRKHPTVRYMELFVWFYVYFSNFSQYRLQAEREILRLSKNAQKAFLLTKRSKNELTLLSQ